MLSVDYLTLYGALFELNSSNIGYYRLRSSIENLVDGPDNEPLITYPDGDTPSEELQLDLSTATSMPMSGELSLTNGQLSATDTVKFEEKRMMSASKTKVITDGFSSEQV